MAHCNFEPAIKWDCIREIARILREDEPGRQRFTAIAQHGACVVGCAGKLFAGDDEAPDPIAVGSRADDTRAEASDADLAAELEGCCPVEGFTQTEAVPWATILEIVLPIILELWRRRQ